MQTVKAPLKSDWYQARNLLKMEKSVHFFTKIFLFETKREQNLLKILILLKIWSFDENIVIF